ncbi:unnamed protein product [Caretta caretta]
MATDKIPSWSSTSRWAPLAKLLCQVAPLVGWDRDEVPLTPVKLAEQMEKAIELYGHNKLYKDWGWGWFFLMMVEKLSADNKKIEKNVSVLVDDKRALMDKNNMLTEALEAAQPGALKQQEIAETMAVRYAWDHHRHLLQNSCPTVSQSKVRALMASDWDPETWDRDIWDSSDDYDGWEGSRPGDLHSRDVQPTIYHYIDDLMIQGLDHDAVERTLQALTTHMQARGWAVNPNKVQPTSRFVKFLGILRQRVQHHIPPVVDQISQLAAPTTKVEAQQVIGLFGNWHNHIPHLTLLLKPFYNVTRKKMAFDWDEAQQWAFEEVKAAIQTAMPLGPYDRHSPFHLEASVLEDYTS